MDNKISFQGASGKGYCFNRVGASAPWARNAGIAIFAAPDAYGWRIISIVELTGRTHDVRPLWALREAERYGARAVFFASEADRGLRQSRINDLEAGLSPVVSRHAEAFLPVAA